jgi:hypothetical protein
MMVIKTSVLALVLCAVAHAQVPTENTKLTALYDADRDWSNARPADVKAAHERHVEVQSMLRAGQVVTGGDFYHAAEIFQSNFDADEALLAHTLAAVSVAKGNQDARWLSATMLDRYLRAIWEPQLFGGEIESSDDGTGTGRYRTLLGLVSDSMRSTMCVAPLSGLNAVSSVGQKKADTKSTRIPCPATSAAQKDNLRIKALADEDQADRDDSKGPVDWPKVAARDLARQKEARHLLDVGEIRTDQDYFNTGLLFQHSQRPEDYLLAHVLAMGASVRGNSDARWLFAVTLDRFLNSISRPQIFGTQFETTAWNPEITQKNLDPNLLSDGLRAGMCIVPLATLSKIPAEVKAGKAVSSQLDPCP